MQKIKKNYGFLIKLTDFLHREPVLCASALAALVTCFFVPPSAEYLEYIDFRTLALLYCLMAVVAGLRQAGVFGAMAQSLCTRAGNGRRLVITLTLMCFFSSMLITNDVALLTFVPFTLVIPGLAGEKRLMIGAIVAETLAANMGSMLTPVGNPQNLYLYSYYQMEAGDFLLKTLPVCALSLILILLLCVLLPNRSIKIPDKAPENGINIKTLAVCAMLFLLCMFTVLRLLEWYILLPVLMAVLLIFERNLLVKADFLLLLTFVFFFIFVGNVGRITGIREILGRLLEGRELYVGALLSQGISNVPAAVLLSGFTDNATGLLLGVNIGGLGTPIASLASLISLKLYSQSEGAEPRPFIKWFLVSNFLMLALLLAVTGLFI